MEISHEVGHLLAKLAIQENDKLDKQDKLACIHEAIKNKSVSNMIMITIKIMSMLTDLAAVT